MQQQITNMTHLRDTLRSHGGPLMVEHEGRRHMVREQHAPFAFVTAMAETRGAPVVNVTRDAVILPIRTASRIMLPA